jgi:hypothetical protein
MTPIARAKKENKLLPNFRDTIVFFPPFHLSFRYNLITAVINYSLGSGSESLLFYQRLEDFFRNFLCLYKK